MLDSPILEAAISLVFISFIFSVLVTCLQEGYVTIRKSRGKMLCKAIDEVLNDVFNKNFGYLFYQHPQVDLLKKKQGSLPSYIDSKTFANALVDLIANESIETVYQKTADGKQMHSTQEIKSELAKKYGITAMANAAANIPLIQKFRMGIDSLKTSDLKTFLQSFTTGSASMADDSELMPLKTQIGAWYEGYMDRVTGWYKRKIRLNLYLAAAIVTLFFNLNFITLSKTIYADSKLRGTLVAAATKQADEAQPIESLIEKFRQDSSLQGIDVAALVGTQLPIGWNWKSPRAQNESNAFRRFVDTVGFYFEHPWRTVVGWLIFILILSLGAPFWFDILKKLINVRNAGIPAGKNNTP